MFRRVIVGVDGGPGGRDAIALARLLLAPGGAITPVHVPIRIRRGEFRSVAPRLHRLVEKSGGDLLVVGSSRHGVWGRVLLGDDTQAALHCGRCTVAVAPRGYALQEPVIQRIGVGYDGTPESEQALAVAGALTRRLGGTLTAFRAVPVSDQSSPAGSIPAGPSVDDLIAEVREELSCIPDVDPEVAYGEPPVELAFFSDSVDLLVVGTQAQRPSGRPLHGSMAMALARSAGCPLLAVSGEAMARQDSGAQDSGTAESPELARPIG